MKAKRKHAPAQMREDIERCRKRLREGKELHRDDRIFGIVICVLLIIAVAAMVYCWVV